MKIVCVMPIYGRRPITLKTIEWLKKQTHPLYKIITVGSSNEDRITAEMAEVDYVEYNNKPLSDKVQFGVVTARKYDPDALLMCGSDSWLSTNWCEITGKYISENADLVGQTQSYTCRAEPHRNLSIIAKRYKHRSDPFGSGRLFSKNALNALDWKLFSNGLNKGLDGDSYKNLTKCIKNAKIVILNNVDNLCILGIKSSLWPTITSFKLIKSAGKNLVDIGGSKDLVVLLNIYFPGWLSDVKDVVPGVII